MRYYKQLDTALKFLSKYNHGSYVYYNMDSDPNHINNKTHPVDGKKDQLYWCFIENNIAEEYRLPIIDHLIGDGFVKPHFDTHKPESEGCPPHQIKITYAGIAFINKIGGGYVNQRIGKRFVRIIRVISTTLITIGAVIGGLWALRQLYEDFLKTC